MFDIRDCFAFLLRGFIKRQRVPVYPVRGVFLSETRGLTIGFYAPKCKPKGWVITTSTTGWCGGLPNKSGNKTQKAHRGHKKHKKENLLCPLWLRFVPFVYLPRLFLGM